MKALTCHKEKFCSEFETELKLTFVVTRQDLKGGKMQPLPII